MKSNFAIFVLQEKTGNLQMIIVELDNENHLNNNRTAPDMPVEIITS